MFDNLSELNFISIVLLTALFALCVWLTLSELVPDDIKDRIRRIFNKKS